jgi:putative pyruvate formate lyase activating enzyme
MHNGSDLTVGQLADKMLALQKKGAHNINFVTPTHFTPQILASLYLAIRKGFNLPIVWNTSGYERIDTLRLLDGVVDIYLPDMKYTCDDEARFLSGAPGYRDINRAAIIEMLRQVGHLECDEEGIGRKGMIIRHLVLPEGRAGSPETLEWIAENLGTETHIALMSQYFPAHIASKTEGIDRRISAEEYAVAVDALEDADLENGWVQEEPL